MKQKIPTVVIFLLLLVHFWSIIDSGWSIVLKSPHARDFASYYYAVEAVFSGKNPYDSQVLALLAQADGTRKSVHPYFYPPPFLLLFSWTRWFSLQEAYRIWFFVSEALILGSCLVLYRWWKPFLPRISIALAVVLALHTAIPDNHQMGQVNALILLICVFAGSLEQKRAGAAGFFYGVAAMLKMSPALFLIFAAFRRQWWIVAGSILAAISLTMLSVLQFGFGLQREFFTNVLPGFGLGAYHGLKVPITLFGNHSLPNLWAQLFPNSVPYKLSPIASILSLVTTLFLIGATSRLIKKQKTSTDYIHDFCIISILLVILPTYTYEHHLVWMLPIISLGLVQASHRPFRFFVSIAYFCCAFFLAFPLKWLDDFSHRYSFPISFLIQESKTLSMGILFLLILHARYRKTP